MPDLLDVFKDTLIACLTFLVVKTEMLYRFGLTTSGIVATLVTYAVASSYLWLILVGDAVCYLLIGGGGISILIWMRVSVKR